jgi:tetratricopeptide (TPR) repeat protein
MSTLRYIVGVLSIGAAIVSPATSYAGSGGESSLYTIESDADREIARRQQELALAEEALRRGDASLKAGNVEQAYLAYKQAVDFTPDGPTTRSLRARALSRYSSTAIRYAEYLVSEGHYAKAEAVARVAVRRGAAAAERRPAERCIVAPTAAAEHAVRASLSTQRIGLCR